MNPLLCRALQLAGLAKTPPSIVTKIIFPTADMAASVAFYERLGFEVEKYDDGYAWVYTEGRELLHLSVYPELDRGENRAAGYFHVQDVDEVHARWSGVVDTTDALGDRPWGMREFSITDPSGNLLRIGQNV